MRGRLAVIRNLEPVRALSRTCRFTHWTLPSAPAPPVSAHLGLPRLRRGSRTTLEGRNARWSCGVDRCVLRHPFVHLTAGWAMHRNGHARKAFEQNPLGLKTGCNECTRVRALNEYISQRRTPSGDAINLCGSVAAPPHCARDRMVGTNVGVATSPAVRHLLCDSILRRAKSPVNFKPVDNSCKLQPSLHRVAQIVVLQFISAMHRGGIRCRRHRADIES